MRRSHFLINNLDPTAARPSTRFVIAEGAAQLTARGLIPGEVLQVEVRVAAVHSRTRSEVEYWGPLARNGCLIQLTPDHTQHLEVIPGEYRLTSIGSQLNPQVVVTLDEEDRDLDGRVVYSYNAAQTCGAGGGPGGPTDITDINYTGGADQWMCDAADNRVWVQAIVDLDTGAKTWSYFAYPGGPAVTPVFPLQPCPFDTAGDRDYQDRTSGIVTGAFSIVLGAGDLRSFTLLVPHGVVVTRTNGPDAGAQFPAGSYSFSAPNAGGQVGRGRFPILPAFTSTGEYMVTWTEG
jgi:hypothetical protein